MVPATSATRLSAERRTTRLAEMVVGLTGCDPAHAVEAVRRQGDGDDPLAIVAAAVVAIDGERRAVLDDIEVTNDEDVDLTGIDVRTRHRRNP